MFMVVMNVRSAIAAESTLSFIGLGLPLEIISWGSMLSLSEKALLSEAWWIILIPGAFLVATMLCVTSIGNWLRGKRSEIRQSINQTLVLFYKRTSVSTTHKFADKKVCMQPVIPSGISPVLQCGRFSGHEAPAGQLPKVPDHDGHNRSGEQKPDG